MHFIRKITIVLWAFIPLLGCGQHGNSVQDDPLDSLDPLAIYKGVDPFENGFAAVSINNQYGFIDKKGRNVVPCKYSHVYEFHDGLAVVERDKKQGLIDTTGREIVPLKYDYISGFEDSERAMVKSGEKWGYIDKKGKEIIPLIYDKANYFMDELSTVQQNDQWFIIDTLNNRKRVKYDLAELGSFYEGRASFRIRGQSDKGYLDREGKIAIQARYQDVSYFDKGLAAVEFNGKKGFVNKKGEEVVPFRYDGYPYFSEGLALVCTNGLCGFVDTNGKELIPLKYPDADAHSFYDGLAIIKMAGKYSCIDKKGDVVIPPIYDEMIQGEGMLAVMKGGQGYYLDLKGNVLFKEVYQEVFPFSDGAARVKQNGIWFFIDKQGKRLF
ncbi:hypothetical protein DBR32_11285 [Taibaiella sp. KBW10]|uniref:WG repeat-containing protein n=1 Tax=Taibaiella sp. KBW10 TaxID=2153357 RepID=UPI000F5A7D73|nr:WG repeat-containing protein [Taibaiella sp. KBW10]RQO30161.1 hypothetical protein DBR32_11285 [Taibaiella sp. KBW10]